MINLTQQERDYLHCKYGNRQEFYKVELLARNGVKKCDLKLLGGNISADADSQIQKAGTINFGYVEGINFLTDRLKIYMGIKIGEALRWYSLGVFLMCKPLMRGGSISCQIYDENILVQQARIDGTKVFLKGTLYTEVLSYLLISLGFIKINIQPSTLTLQTDLILDGTKNNLEWFNYLTEQINYTNLYVNSEGWFVSKKYIEPSPLNVGYIYQSNDMSVLVGEPDITMDIWQVANIFTRIVSHPTLGELKSTYINEDPTDPYSVKNREKITDRQIVDNIASQIELDNLTRKAAFNTKQITQDVVFTTLNMPHHEINDILDLRHGALNGIFVESGWNVDLKAGSKMSHRAKRLVRLDDKY